MLTDDKIREALSAKAEEVVLPADLLEHIQREHGHLIMLTRSQRLWQIVRRKLVVTIIGLVLLALLAAVMAMAGKSTLLQASEDPGAYKGYDAASPGTDEITLVRYYFGGGPWREETPLPLRADDPADREVITKLWEWITAGEERGTGTHYMRGSPTLEITLRNGKQIGVGLPQGCLDCQEVMVSREGSSAIYHAPELYDWLLGGFEADLRFGTRQ